MHAATQETVLPEWKGLAALGATVFVAHALTEACPAEIMTCSDIQMGSLISKHDGDGKGSL